MKKRKYLENVLTFLSKLLAFIKRDFLIEISYKFHFALQFFGILAHLLTFYFISRLVVNNQSQYLTAYGGEYFPFVLIGIAFQGYFNAGLLSFAQNIRREQLMGTLEALLATPNRISFIIVSSSLWSFIWASISVLVYLSVGSLFFEYKLNLSSLFSGFLILILSIIIFSSIGIISAGFVIIFKRGIPFTWAIGMTSGLLGGVYYPVEVMPQFLKIGSNFIPLKYSLEALRKLLLLGIPFRDVYLEFLTLILFVLILLPIALSFFKFAVKKAKIDGSLVFY